MCERFNVKDIMKKLTLEEKAQLISGGGIYVSRAIQRLGIPSALFIDACCGINIRQYLEALYDAGVIRDDGIREENGTEGIATMARFGHIAENIETRENLSGEDNRLLDEFLSHIETLIGVKEYPSCFPSNTLLAATWNREAVYEDACAVGKEASAYGVDVLLGTPCINIQRDGRGGRGFENYSEDPYLTAELSSCFAQGINEQGIITNAKHFAANNQETERMRIDEIIPERALYEIYFPAFKACVRKGGVKSIMSAYNWINGKPCAQNEWLLRDVLRNEWGFDGFVVSDWRAAYDLVQAVRAGNDLAMPGPRDEQEIINALQDGMLSIGDLDEAVEHFLKVLVSMPVMQGRKFEKIDFKDSSRTAYETAAEGITLLKNKDHVLPLTDHMEIAVFGEKAGRFIESGIGSGHVFTDKTSSLLENIKKTVGEDHVSVNAFTEKTEVAIVVVSTEGQEGGDCADIQLKRNDMKMLSEVTGYSRKRGIKVVLIMNIAGPVEMTDFIENIDACLDIYYPGQEGAVAVADILFGRRNPSGKLPHTFPRSYRDCPSYGNFPGYNEKVYYGEGIYVGYRWYDTRRIEPMFPFGFGLSYTTFRIRDIQLSNPVLNVDADEKVNVSVTVENTGNMQGKEVVQLYVRDNASTLDKPEKELKGFEKVDLLPGETKTVVFEIGKEDLSSYDTKLHAWTCEPGEFEILIGSSSRNIQTQEKLMVVGRNPYGYCGDTPITKLSMDERAVNIILDNLEGYVTEKEFFNIAYFGQRHSLDVVWNTMLTDSLTSLNKAERDALYHGILEELAGLDVSEANLREKYVF